MNGEAHACEVCVPFLGARCGQPAAGLYRRACVHEHMRDGYVCTGHVETAGHGLCLTCYNLDGHDCPITLAPVAVAP